eukprot:1147821-Pelagomonas_calceolata.AAC.17
MALVAPQIKVRDASLPQSASRALETSHAIAFLDVLCPDLPGSQNIVVNCSGRGDKDVNTAIRLLGM